VGGERKAKARSQIALVRPYISLWSSARAVGHAHNSISQEAANQGNGHPCLDNSFKLLAAERQTLTNCLLIETKDQKTKVEFSVRVNPKFSVR
jgi:hypothetical protein